MAKTPARNIDGTADWLLSRTLWELVQRHDWKNDLGQVRLLYTAEADTADIVSLPQPPCRRPGRLRAADGGGGDLEGE